MDIDTTDEYNNLANHPTLHPLASVIDFFKIKPGEKLDGDVSAVQSFCIVPL